MYTEPKIVGELLGLPGPKCLHQDLTVAEAVFSVVVELCHVTRGGLLGVVVTEHGWATHQPQYSDKQNKSHFLEGSVLMTNLQQHA